MRECWEQVALAQRRGVPMPPIEVYRVGGLHFVSDGHHQVSIAAASGQQTIDAYVTEILTARPPNATVRGGLNPPATTPNRPRPRVRSRRRPPGGPD